MSQQKILIDGLGLVEGHFSGVGQYILGILKGIDERLGEMKYAGEDTPTVRVIIPYDTVAKFKSFGFNHVGYKVFPLTFRLMSALWHRGKLPPIDLWCGKAKYIFPRFVNMPLLFSGKSPLVIFDLSYELYRQYSDEGNAIFLSKRVRDSLKTTSKVIAISSNAREELIDFYKLDPKDVLLATPATDPALLYRRSQEEIDNVKRKYGITGNYILALSNLEPRKNLDSLVDAYCALPEKLRKNTSLLLVGVSGWKTDQLFQKIITKVNEGYNILRPSEYVRDEDKAAIISGASLLVYPSHYEGFGMPPLEALACGTPVITSDNSSLPEVVGEVCTTVPSTDRKKLTDAVTNALSNLEELTAASIIDGPRQAAKFSWKKSGQVFLDAVKDTK